MYWALVWAVGTWPHSLLGLCTGPSRGLGRLIALLGKDPLVGHISINHRDPYLYMCNPCSPYAINLFFLAIFFLGIKTPGSSPASPSAALARAPGRTSTPTLPFPPPDGQTPPPPLSHRGRQGPSCRCRRPGRARSPGRRLSDPGQQDCSQA